MPMKILPTMPPPSLAASVGYGNAAGVKVSYAFYISSACGLFTLPCSLGLLISVRACQLFVQCFVYIKRALKCCTHKPSIEKVFKLQAAGRAVQMIALSGKIRREMVLSMCSLGHSWSGYPCLSHICSWSLGAIL